MAEDNTARLDVVLRTVAYLDAPRVRRDVLEALRHAPYLVPKEDELFQEVSPGDWQPCKLLSLEGVLAYSHEDKVYYCPVQVYVQTEHPRRAPTVFVRPAADMIIERNASYVDSSGALNLESLRAWGVTSSIAAVLGEMSTKFGETSPLRRRPTSLRPGAAAGGAGAGGAGLRYAATASEAAEAAKLRSSLTESLRAQLSEWYGRLVEALDEHETDGELLRSQLEQESREAAQATSRAEELEAYVAAVRAKVEAADAWLAENETGADDLDAEAAVVAAYPLHQQLLRSVARTNAIEDALDALRAALTEDTVSLKGYLRETRKQAKALFTERLVSRRISEALEAAPSEAASAGAPASGARMASGAGPPGYGSAPGAPPGYGSAQGGPPGYGSAPGGPPGYGSAPGGPPGYAGSAAPGYGGGAGPAGYGPAAMPGYMAGAAPSAGGAPVPGYLRR